MGHKKQGSSPANLTATEFLIMKSLVGSSGKEMYGLELVEKSLGKLKRGTIYVLLGRLEEKGFISSRTETAGTSAIPRRMYKPTGMGAKVFEAWRSVAEMGGLHGAFA